MDFNSLFSTFATPAQPAPVATPAYGFGNYGVGIIFILVLIFIWSRFRAGGFPGLPGYAGPVPYSGYGRFNGPGASPYG
jgi:hypothetical protein